MSENDQDVLGNSNSNSENVEEKLVSLKEIEKKLEDELGHIQDIGGKLIAEHENIGSIVGHVKKIQSEIENAKQLFVKFQAKEDKKERCNRDLTPQKLFEEFREKFKEDKKNREKPKTKSTIRKLFNKPSLMSVIIGFLLIIFSTICFSLWVMDKIPIIPDCLYLVFILIFIIFSFFYYKREREKKAKGQNTPLIDGLVLLSLIILISTTIIYHGQRDQSLFSLIMNLLSLDKIICIIIVMSLLIKLDYMDNSFKNLLEEEKEQAVLSIKQVLNDRGITITIDLIRTLLTFKDEIGSGLISEYKRSIIRPIFVSVAIASVVFGVFLKFLGELSVVNILIVLGVSILINRLFKHYYEDIHDRDLYIEALKDTEFKEVLEQSKKRR